MSHTAEIAAGFPPTSFYKLDPGRFAEYRRKLVIRLSIVVPPLLAGLSYLAWHFDKERSYFRLALIPALIGWITYRQLFKDKRREWESLVLEFREGKLIRRLDKYPVLELVPSEVSEILESPRGIIIRTSNRQRGLFLSNRLLNYDAFRSQLISWAPAARVAVWHPVLWNYLRNFSEVLACVCVFGGPLYLMYTSRQALILPLGIALSLSMLAMILYVRNSPHIPVRAQKGLLILLLLPILAMLIRLL
jgi:hypothetical protein